MENSYIGSAVGNAKILFYHQSLWNPWMRNLQAGSAHCISWGEKIVHKGTCTQFEASCSRVSYKYKVCTYKRMLVRNFKFSGVEH